MKGDNVTLGDMLIDFDTGISVIDDTLKGVVVGIDGSTSDVEVSSGILMVGSIEALLITSLDDTVSVEEDDSLVTGPIVVEASTEDDFSSTYELSITEDADNVDAISSDDAVRPVLFVKLLEGDTVAYDVDNTLLDATIFVVLIGVTVGMEDRTDEEAVDLVSFSDLSTSTSFLLASADALADDSI